MKYDHVVNHNGIYYQAGEEVPETNDKINQSANEKRTEGEEKSLSSVLKENDYSDSDIQLETAGHTYTYDELEEMPVREIRKLAQDKGFEITKTIKDDVINEFLSKQ